MINPVQIALPLQTVYPVDNCFANKSPGSLLQNEDSNATGLEWGFNAFLTKIQVILMLFSMDHNSSSKETGYQNIWGC